VTVVEVGPGAVRGPNAAPAEQVSAALEGIDDDHVLVDEQPVAVDELWRAVLGEVVGPDADAVTLVVPRWWPAARIERVRAAAADVATAVQLTHRVTLLRECGTEPAGIVEIADELVVVTPPVGQRHVLARCGDPDADTDAVVAAAGSAHAVLIDAPDGVAGAQPLAMRIAERLRRAGAAVRFAPDLVPDLVPGDGLPTPTTPPGPAGPARSRRPLAAAAGVAAVALLGAGVAAGGAPEPESPTLFEGPVAVTVPSGWQAHRVTGGPGTARVEVRAPGDRDAALHITHAVGGPDTTLADTAAALHAALRAEDDAAAFADFRPLERRAGRDAVTYRERRPGREIAWTVVVDAGVRIAIGCQYPAQRPELIREPCEAAIRSARVVRGGETP